MEKSRESVAWVVLLAFCAIAFGLAFLLYLFLFASDPAGGVAGLPYPIILVILAAATPAMACTAVRAARQRAAHITGVPAQDRRRVDG